MEKRIVGIITVDDILEIYDQASTEDIHKMAAIMGEDIPYTEASVFSLWKKRIPWLLILMISAAFTGAIISHYEKALAAYVILTTFIPMFMDTAGNAGNQTSVTVIRSIALGEIDFKDYFKILRKEFSVAFFCGLTLAAANFLKIILIDHVSMTIAFVVCITLLITVICAKVVGCSLDRKSVV